LLQCDSANQVIGTIVDKEQFERNLKQNCIPAQVISMSAEDYFDFLVERRMLMAKKIKGYYFSL